MAESIELEIRAIDLATNVIDKVTNSITGGLKNAALAVGAAFVASIGAAVLTLKDLSEAAGEAQESQARFNALVDSSGLADFKGEMLGFADALAKVTRFEDENILEAEAMLSTYDTIGRETFPAVLDATLDLAEFMKTDATSAAQTLGRAFADIEGGSLSLLRRSRLLTAEQVKMAEEMAKAGDVAGAQALIIEALDGKIGNLAETMGQTFEGQKTIFLNALNNIKEELGMKLLPILTPVIEKFGLLAEKYAPMLFEAFDTYIVPAVENAVDVFTRFMDALGEGNLKEFFEGIDWAGIGDTISESLIGMSDAFKDWAREVDWQAVSDEISDGIDEIDWAGFGQDVRTFSANMWKGIKEAADEIDWEKIKTSLNVALLEALAGVTGQKDMDNVVDTWVANIQNAPGWKGLGTYIGMTITDSIKETASVDMTTGFDELIENIKEGLQNGNWSSVSGMVAQKISEALTLSEIGKTKGAELAVGVIAGLGAFPTMIFSYIQGTLVPSIADSLGMVKKEFFNAFQGAMQQAIQALNGMRSSVMKAVQSFMDAIRVIVGKGIQMAVTVSIPSLAAFAKMAATLAAGMAMLQAAMQGGGNSLGAQGSSAALNKPKKINPQHPGGGGFASGGISRGPDSGHMELLHGDEAVIPLQNGAVPVAMGGRGGGNLILNLTYAPAFSTADQSELLNNLMPMLNQWYRQRLAS